LKERRGSGFFFVVALKRLARQGKPLLGALVARIFGEKTRLRALLSETFQKGRFHSLHRASFWLKTIHYRVRE